MLTGGQFLKDLLPSAWGNGWLQGITLEIDWIADDGEKVDRTSDVVHRYLSDLYSHPEFPTKSPGDLQPELQRKVTGGWKKVLCPKRMFRYLKAIRRKHKTGQPVSFTDLFGHMRKTCTLSEQSAKLTRGELPLPMYTCLQVKKDVSARVYQVRSDDQPQQGDSLGRRYAVPSELDAVMLRCCDTVLPSVATLCRPNWTRWCYDVVIRCYQASLRCAVRTGRGDVTMLRYGATKRRYAVLSEPDADWLEFTPYEVGFSKHGASMKPSLFGNRLYLGRVITPYNELPLHYLQGVWGSAYTIFFRRVIESGRRDALNPQQEDADDDSRLLKAERTFSKDFTRFGGRVGKPPPVHSTEIRTSISPSSAVELNTTSALATEAENHLSSRDDSKDPTSSSEGTTEGDEDSEVCTSSETETSSQQALEGQRPQDKANEVTLLSLIMARYLHSAKKIRHGRKWNFRRRVSRARSGRKKRKRHRTFWQMILSKLLRGRLLDSRSGRAGVVFNPVRGLKFCSPCAPYVGNPATTTPDDDVDFQGFYEPLAAHTKKLYLVDSGLSFNLPFPALLRPQRDVDFFLVFEFSNRTEDESSPFGELLLAEKWARLRNASFPPVSQQVEEFLKQPLRECYLFEDTEDPCCPVILFFVLINKSFRTHKDVDVLRATQEEKDFADFEIFDDPADPFSSFNFRYSQLQFDRLTRLVEFNTRLYEPMIREQMEGAVLKKRRLLDKSADH
uniref:PLA2c domain-containing protein n=1 Tax=Timema genevievae TaxID=629358 RepID=A0A7R9PKX2_TIMGE|nr:unnamed protein product [Timema genevievae]